MKENLNDWAKRMRQMAEADCDPQEVVSEIIGRSGELKAILGISDAAEQGDDRDQHHVNIDQRTVADMIAKRMKECGIDAE